MRSTAQSGSRTPTARPPQPLWAARARHAQHDTNHSMRSVAHPGTRTPTARPWRPPWRGAPSSGQGSRAPPGSGPPPGRAPGSCHPPESVPKRRGAAGGHVCGQCTSASCARSRVTDGMWATQQQVVSCPARPGAPASSCRPQRPPSLPSYLLQVCCHRFGHLLQALLIKRVHACRGRATKNRNESVTWAGAGAVLPHDRGTPLQRREGPAEAIHDIKCTHPGTHPAMHHTTHGRLPGTRCWYRRSPYLRASWHMPPG